MATPTTSGEVSFASLSGVHRIDSLLWGTKWGGATGSAVQVSYSFPGFGSSWSTDFSSGYGTSSGSGEPWSRSFAPLTGSQQAAAQLALQKWANVAAIGFVLSPDDSATVGDIRFAWTGRSGEQAHAYIPAQNEPQGGDIWLNALARWGDFSPGTYSFATLLHEIGHAIGLKHPFDLTSISRETLSTAEDSVRNTVMSYSAYPGAAPGSGWQFEPTTPMPFDIQAAQYLYGPNNSYHAGDDTYAYFAGQRYFETIWDAGGNDTIQYNAASDHAEIDLRPGALSDLGINLISTDGLRTTPYDVVIYQDVVIENAIGGDGPDLIYGNDAANVLQGRGGADTILAGAADDSLDGGSANDNLDAGAGDDTLYTSGGLDTYNGGAGTDTLDFSSRAGAGVFVWLGYTGDPIEAWSAGVPLGDVVSIENLVDSAQSDFLRGDAAANRFGYSAGLDYIDGQAGIDTADFSRLGYGVRATLTTSEARNATSNAKLADLVNVENVIGSAFNDGLTGDASSNVLDGSAGNDTLYFSGGLDTYNGAAGSDTLDFSSRAGAGVFVWLGYTGDPIEAWSAGVPLGDVISVENLVGSAQSDFLRGDAAANTFGYSAGLDYFDGQGGIDTVDFSRLDFGVRATLGAFDARNATSNVKLADLVSVENVIGSASDDKLTGDASSNVLDGSTGTDTLYFSGGLDTYNGAAGSDTLDFSSYAGAGVFVWLGYTGDPIEAWSAGVPLGDVISVENLVGSAQSDFLRGDAAANTFGYSAGLDYFDGQAGIDTVDFSRLDFGVRATLGAFDARNATSNVKLADLVDVENLIGSSSSDQLTGDSSSNVLNGDAGNDALTGGGAPDRFIYATGGGLDTIGDFSIAQGDVLDLSSVLTGYVAGVSSATAFVRLAQSGANTTVEVNTDGVGSDFVPVVTLQNFTGQTLNTLLSQGNLDLS